MYIYVYISSYLFGGKPEFGVTDTAPRRGVWWYRVAMGSCIWYIWDVPREIPSVLKFQTRSVCVYGTAKDETSRFSYVLHTRSTYVKITRMCIITTFIISLYRILNPPQEQLLIYAKKHAPLSTYPQPFSTFFSVWWNWHMCMCRCYNLHNVGW